MPIDNIYLLIHLSIEPIFLILIYRTELHSQYFTVN